MNDENINNSNRMRILSSKVDKPYNHERVNKNKNRSSVQHPSSSRKGRNPLVANKMPVPEAEYHAALDSISKTRTLFIEKQKEKCTNSSWEGTDEQVGEKLNISLHNRDHQESKHHSQSSIQHKNKLKQSIVTIQEMERHLVRELNRLVDPIPYKQYENKIMYDTPIKMELQRNQTTGDCRSCSSDSSQSSSSIECSYNNDGNESDNDTLSENTYDEEELLDQKALERVRDLRSQIRIRSDQICTLREEQMIKMENLVQEEMDRYMVKTNTPIDSSLWEESAKQLVHKMKQISNHIPELNEDIGANSLTPSQLEQRRHDEDHFKQKVKNMQASIQRLMSLIENLQVKVPESITAFKETLDTVQHFISQKKNNSKMSGTERAIISRVGGNGFPELQYMKQGDNDKNGTSVGDELQMGKGVENNFEVFDPDKGFALFMAS